MKTQMLATRPPSPRLPGRAFSVPERGLSRTASSQRWPSRRERSVQPSNGTRYAGRARATPHGTSGSVQHGPPAPPESTGVTVSLPFRKGACGTCLILPQGPARRDTRSHSAQPPCRSMPRVVQDASFTPRQSHPSFRSRPNRACFPSVSLRSIFFVQPRTVLTSLSASIAAQRVSFIETGRAAQGWYCGACEAGNTFGCDHPTPRGGRGAGSREDAAMSRTLLDFFGFGHARRRRTSQPRLGLPLGKSRQRAAFILAVVQGAVD
jgi:hypothetical protein